MLPNAQSDLSTGYDEGGLTASLIVVPIYNLELQCALYNCGTLRLGNNLCTLADFKSTKLLADAETVPFIPQIVAHSLSNWDCYSYNHRH